MLAIVVNDPGDFIDANPNVTTLREAVQQANLSPDLDTIQFAPSLNGATIDLTLGQLSITQSLTIDGTDTNGVPLGITIDASQADPTPEENNGDGIRIFDIFGSGTLVTLNSLTLTGGDVETGGAIYTRGTLIVQDCEITGNAAYNNGGAIYADLADSGGLTITNTTLSYNHSTNAYGGALFISAQSPNSQTITISNSVVTGNYAYLEGGGIAVGSVPSTATVNIEKSVITGNTAEAGGGGGVKFGGNANFIVEQVYVADNVAGQNGGGLDVTNNTGLTVIRDSTFYNNTASTIEESGCGGGGISLKSNGNDVITNCTISGNSAVNGGGLRLSGTPRVLHSTIVRNTAWVPGGAHVESGGGGVFFQVITPPQSSYQLFEHSIIAQNSHIQAGNEGYTSPPYQDSRNLSPDIGVMWSVSAPYYPGDFDRGDWVEPTSPWTTVRLDYTIVGNLTGPLKRGAFVDATGVGSMFGNEDENDPIDPLLGDLADNGGPDLPDGYALLTHMPIYDPGGQGVSPAIDAGNPDISGEPEYDERGFPFDRVVDIAGLRDVGGSNPRIDIGAVEVQPPDTTPPRVVDVRLEGTGWTGAQPYSYAEIVPTGMQLAPFYTQGVNTIQIEFSEHVMRGDGSDLNGSEFVLYGSEPSTEWPYPTIVVPKPFTFGYDPDTHVATLSFSTPLGGDKYRLEVSTEVSDAAGHALDGEWDNFTDGTPDDFLDDGNEAEDFTGHPNRLFPSGNGTPGSDENHFAFWFSLLPGDSNQDGVVDDADDDAGVLKDINGDGAVSGTDETLVSGLIGTSLPVRNKGGAHGNRGDYQDDELVDPSDYIVWRMTFGSTDDLRADGNGNSIVDAADYTAWADNEDNYSAWFTGTPPGGSGQIIVQFGIAPTVVNVTISGSSSLHDPYSFDSVVGSGEQLRTVPVGGADTISIAFSEDVNVSAESLTLTGLYTANRPTLAEFSYDMGTQTATWRFEGWALGDQYLVSLSDAVTDVEGDRLDGEWVNPASIFTTNAAVSEFPSGDGEGGGDFNFVVTLLPGDANLDLVVNGTDYQIFASHLGTMIGALFTDGDFSGDRQVTFYGDYFLMRGVGTNLQEVWVLADLNGDLSVDQADVDILFENLEDNLQDPTWADGDLDGDGEMTVADLDLMFQQFGLELALVS